MVVDLFLTCGGADIKSERRGDLAPRSIDCSFVHFRVFFFHGLLQLVASYKKCSTLSAFTFRLMSLTYNSCYLAGLDRFIAAEHGLDRLLVPLEVDKRRLVVADAVDFMFMFSLSVLISQSEIPQLQALSSTLQANCYPPTIPAGLGSSNSRYRGSR